MAQMQWYYLTCAHPGIGEAVAEAYNVPEQLKSGKEQLQDNIIFNLSIGDNSHTAHLNLR